MNHAGTPAICLPSGFSQEGLPYSIQFAGRRLSEPVLCRIAHAYECAPLTPTTSDRDLTFVLRPQWDSLRADPRFDECLVRMKLRRVL
jgi:hypothetical protein